MTKTALPKAALSAAVLLLYSALCLAIASVAVAQAWSARIIMGRRASKFRSKNRNSP